MFNTSKSNEIWVMLLEKGWAKVHGGYLNISAGLTREALHDLTGAPAITYFSDEGTSDHRWDIIMDAEKKNFIMSAGSDDLNGNGRDDREETTGIVGSHAYSMISAVELIYDQGSYRKKTANDTRTSYVERLVELRNPWGKGEWKGKWNDKDRRWTASLKRDLGHVDEEDGKFYMPFEEFEKYFSDFQICYYHDTYLYSAFRYNTAKNETLRFKFNLQKQGDYYFS